MTNSITERLLFVVAVDPVKLENQPTKDFITQIKHYKSSLIRQIQKAIKENTALAERVNLLTLDNYLNLFAGIVEVDSTIIKEEPDKVSRWQIEGNFVPLLLQTIFSGHDSNLIWTLIRVNTLGAEQVESFSLLGMDGISSSK